MAKLWCGTSVICRHGLPSIRPNARQINSISRSSTSNCNYFHNNPVQLSILNKKRSNFTIKCNRWNSNFSKIVDKSYLQPVELEKEDLDEVKELCGQLENGERAGLARAITLVQSRHPTKRAQGDLVLRHMMQVARENARKFGPEKSLIFRIGISGPPGVGKSTFIESFGKLLVNELNKKLAVLCIDPSSHTTAGKLTGKGPIHQSYGGSILGDLARMTDLSRLPNAFIRQSPTHGALGGVTRGTHEAVVLCEGAGYDIVFIETVGVGQSEVSVVDMVDMFVLLLSPAHGDELQGVKRGIMELVDLIVVTKADGELKNKAKITQSEYMSALKYMKPRSKNWTPPVLRASSVTGEGLHDVWQKMEEFWHIMSQTGDLKLNRDRQLSSWMWHHVQEELMNTFLRNDRVHTMASDLDDQVHAGSLTPGAAAEQLLRLFFVHNDEPSKLK